ncbi:MAG: diguanylate cyclase response regulator [Moraxellaceae bacterium]|nr:MAG: diguanylate cyclase response regulator [Moraxellaceae bacterium]
MIAPSDDTQTDDVKPRLLMIDDSKLMRKSAVKMLGADFDVVVAEDGREGLKKINEDDAIQVVFTDLNMPNLDGYELLQAIRTSQDEGIRNLPVIVVTGAENDDEAKELAYSNGATDFITKPFNSTDLRARAQAHADYQRNTKALLDNSNLDALTQLGNGTYFQERLAQDVSFVSRHQEDFAIMVVELNAFNELFLKIGRSAADSVIKQIAKVLQKAVRKEDTVSRLGLSQFAVSLPTAKSDGAVQLAKRICRVVDSFKAKFRGETVSISVSVGVYIPVLDRDSSAEMVLAKAQEALEEALTKGRGQVHATHADKAVEKTATPIVEQTPRAEAVEQTSAETAAGILAELDAELGTAAPMLPSAASSLDSISIDQALSQLKAGEQDVVALKLPVIVKRLEPLLNLLNEAQKQSLIETLSN